MYRKFLNARSPLRLLEKGLHGGLGTGNLGLVLAVEWPERVGADRLANAAGAYHLFGGPLVVVDVGTAITVCAVTADGRYLGGVRVFATVAGGIQEVVLGTNAVELGLGNDPPRIETVQPIPSTTGPDGDEFNGPVAVELVLADTSSDLIDVRAEFDVVDDFPDTGWRLARPAGQDTTPEFALGRIFEAALRAALEDVFASGDAYASEGIQQSSATREFWKRNCSLIGS